jgi:hypothetical protein
MVGEGVEEHSDSDHWKGHAPAAKAFIDPKMHTADGTARAQQFALTSGTHTRWCNAGACNKGKQRATLHQE